MYLLIVNLNFFLINLRGGFINIRTSILFAL